MVQMGDIAQQGESVRTPSPKLITISKWRADATGNVAYTGVGFRPSAIMFMANGENAECSFGWSTDGSNNHFSENHHGATADTWEGGTTKCIQSTQGASITHTAAIVTMDADGFTLGWTRTGAPTGTTNVRVTAFK
jgi:hypothetical protein